MAIGMDTNFINAALHRAFDEAREEIVKDVIEKSKTEIEQRIKKETDKIALNVLEFYSVERHGSNLVITVKKEINNG